MITWNPSPPTSYREVRVEDDMRDALQCVAAVRPPAQTRLDLLDRAGAVGVHVSFVGFPAASNREREDCLEMVRHLARSASPIRAVLMARAVEGDVDAVADVQARAGAAVVADIYVPISAIRLQVEGWRLDTVLERLAFACELARERGLEFRVAFEDSTRAREEDLARALDVAVDLGTSEIVLNDTVGEAMPEGARRHTAFAVEHLGRRGAAASITWHGHNDQGLALANALAAIDGGASMISGTFLGVGERVGNIPLEQLMVILAGAGNPSFDLRQIVPMCSAVAEAVGMPIPLTQPLVGGHAFSTSTGTHAAALQKAREHGPEVEDLVYSGVAAAQLGRRQSVRLGPNSGRRAVASVLMQLGIEPDGAVVDAVLAECGARREALTDHEVRDIASSSVGEPPPGAAMYRDFDDAFRVASGSELGIRNLLSPTTVELPGRDDASVRQRAADLRAYQRRLIELWQGDVLPDWVLRVPTWAAPVPDGPWRHVSPDRLLPLFSRTDQSADGAIFEIQCPGSWWGATHLLQERVLPDAPTLAASFVAELRTVFPDGACILHLFESSTSPHENQLFAHEVRRVAPIFRFWGIDPHALTQQCNLVRAHSFGALVAEDLFRVRLGHLASGTLRFDMPPVALFDQKVAMALPFEPDTRHHFDDPHRSLFPHTSLVRSDGTVHLQDGQLASLRELADRPAGERRYVLKYAGGDATRNFGSAGVWLLAHASAADARAVVDLAIADADRWEPWILQEEKSSTRVLDVVLPDGRRVSEERHIKVSEFFGPTRSLAALVQGSTEPAVRWTPTTVLAIAEPPTSQLAG